MRPCVILVLAMVGGRCELESNMVAEVGRVFNPSRHDRTGKHCFTIYEAGSRKSEVEASKETGFPVNFRLPTSDLRLEAEEKLNN
jgi:hypothetical protein